MNGIKISNELELINATYNNSDETILITRETENSIYVLHHLELVSP